MKKLFDSKFKKATLSLALLASVSWSTLLMADPQASAPPTPAPVIKARSSKPLMI